MRPAGGSSGVVVFSEQGLGGRVLEVEDCGRLIDRKAVLENHLD